MAPISKFLSFLFLTTLSFSLQIHARDSQFFSKVTHVDNNNVKDRDVPNPNNEGSLNKPEQQQQQQQQPEFIPETENSYGLYGHDSGLHPPTTTTNTNNVDPNTYHQSYEKTSQDQNNNVNNYFNYQKDSSYSKYPNEISDTKLTGTSYTNNNNYYHNNKYDSNEFSNTKFPEEGYNNNNNKYYYNNNIKDASNSNEFSNTKFTEEESNNKNNKYYYNNNIKDASNSNELSNTKLAEEEYNKNNKYYYNNNVASNNNGERQGMSDTRVMEGGKYYYDVSSEKYNPTFNGDSSSKGVVNSENWYNKKGYFGNNNNVNNYESNKNSMDGYQNQEEFEADQEEFEP
ncbi:hypothetical protein TSUD_64120 [Trifolium subterraneum]|uniref:Protein E6 n=1 Tax=Trifolium subterraneum TaxID=3900 RepID=A0A2Z6N6N0_TRISU|nr:hypothetical protein TSUD_64120 [Trifolium subterraneum]